jgi:hypothetical protein
MQREIIKRSGFISSKLLTFVRDTPWCVSSTYPEAIKPSTWRRPREEVLNHRHPRTRSGSIVSPSITWLWLVNYSTMMTKQTGLMKEPPNFATTLPFPFPCYKQPAARVQCVVLFAFGGTISPSSIFYLLPPDGARTTSSSTTNVPHHHPSLADRSFSILSPYRKNNPTFSLPDSRKKWYPLV